MGLLYVFNHYFFENEHMHFGFWEDGLEVKYQNLKAAQERYVEEIFKLVPAEAETVLDVGSGSGEMAAHLDARGYRVDCVCPPTILSHYAKQKLRDKADLFECRYDPRPESGPPLAGSFRLVWLSRIKKYRVTGSLFGRRQPFDGRMRTHLIMEHAPLRDLLLGVVE